MIARNDREHFSFNRVVSHFYEAHRIDELSRGSILGNETLTITSAQNVLLAKSCVLLVFCVVSTNLLTVAAAGAILLRHSPDANGGIQWLQVKPGMCSIG